MSGETLDDIAVARLMMLLLKLVELELGRFAYSPPPSDSTPRQDNPGPFALNILRFDIPDIHSRPHENTSSISGFFRIISLFHIKRPIMGQSHSGRNEFSTSIRPTLDFFIGLSG